jgi:hypothetical protein
MITKTPFMRSQPRAEILPDHCRKHLASDIRLQAFAEPGAFFQSGRGLISRKTKPSHSVSHLRNRFYCKVPFA